MMNFKKSLTKILPILFLGLLALPGGGKAANFSFMGTFNQDDEVQLFNFSVGALSNVTLKTLSYAGGTNAQGMIIPAGGFDPILALFDGTTLDLIDANDDGSFPDVGIDPVTGEEYDTYLEVMLSAGDYIVSVMQFDNFPFGNNLSDGFWRDGAGNFTGGFIDFTGDQRTNKWAFDILNVEDALIPNSPVPEPSTILLLGSGVVGLVAWKRKYAKA